MVVDSRSYVSFGVEPAEALILPGLVPALVHFIPSRGWVPGALSSQKASQRIIIFFPLSAFLISSFFLFLYRTAAILPSSLSIILLLDIFFFLFFCYPTRWERKSGKRGGGKNERESSGGIEKKREPFGLGSSCLPSKARNPFLGPFFSLPPFLSFCFSLRGSSFFPFFFLSFSNFFLPSCVVVVVCVNEVDGGEVCFFGTLTTTPS